MVRGLALRSLCNLRMPGVLEYVQQPLNKGLNDLSAYVRRVAVMGVLKMYRFSPETVATNDWKTQLQDKLQDVDAIVSSNVLVVINEMCLSTGGMEVNQASVMHLLNRLGEFNEWGMQAVLDYVSRYHPTAEDETFAIMNLLDPVLRSANSGAVLACIRCFMTLTENFPELRQQIWLRAKPPLLTFVTGASPETQFAVLKHLQLILPEPAASGVFDDEYRQLFVRYNEPPHVKHLKVDLLPLVTCEATARDVASELAEYVTDVDAELARHAIMSMGHIAERIPLVAGDMMNLLVGLIDLDMPYVRAAAVVQMCAVSRAHPATTAIVLQHISKCLARVEDPQARSAVLHILGEHSAKIDDAPYLLERLIDEYEEEVSALVKLSLLSATVKCFFARPPETQKMLGRLLRAGLNDSSDQDVHDRALLYYRLLRTDVETARNVLHVSGESLPLPEGGFAERRDQARRNALMEEFNSLAIIYEEPSRQFVAADFQLRLDMAPIQDDTFAPPVHAGASSSANSAAPMLEEVGSTGDLLGDWGDNSPSPVPTSASGSAGLTLLSGCSTTSQQFQQSWAGLSPAFNGSLCELNCAPTAATLSAKMSNFQWTTVASGTGPNGAGCKLFLFGQEADTSSLLASGQWDYLVQLICTPTEATAMIKTTSTDPSAGEKAVALLKQGLR